MRYTNTILLFGIFLMLLVLNVGLPNKLNQMKQLQTETNLLLGTQNCYMLNDSEEPFWECVNDNQDN